ncbi:hypothetical protein B0H14DRAFT_2631669 [Mycena olivaceomarginata]|nr:hypothetical protein B0H14DRAFT_2631669 [Mycena olivaceomarginata]
MDVSNDTPGIVPDCERSVQRAGKDPGDVLAEIVRPRDESPQGPATREEWVAVHHLFQDIFPTDDDADLRKRQEEIVKILRKVARDVIGKDDFKLIFRDKHGFNINWDGFYPDLDSDDSGEEAVEQPPHKVVK